MTIPVFDGHNDFLLRLFHEPHRRRALWCDRNTEGHMDLPRLQKAGFAGGLFAIFVPSSQEGSGAERERVFDFPPYDLATPAQVSHREAFPAAVAMASHLAWMVRSSGGALRVSRTVAEMRTCQKEGCIAAVLHLEGAEAVDEELAALDTLAEMGLRSLGPVWSRPNAFGYGVPFLHPSGVDTGPGLTAAGFRLVKECNRRRILIDLSHLNEAGFNDVARTTDAPLVASHACAHAVSPSSRNLTDRQLSMIADSGGLVGLSFATIMLRRDGRRSPTMGWSALLRHLDHLLATLGEDHVGFGSDFDGATVPALIGHVTGIGRLQDALRAHGFNTPLLRKVCYENWQAVLERTWGE